MGRTGPLSGGTLMWRPLYENSDCGRRFRFVQNDKTNEFKGYLEALIVLFNLDEMIVE